MATELELDTQATLAGRAAVIQGSGHAEMYMEMKCNINTKHKHKMRNGNSNNNKNNGNPTTRQSHKNQTKCKDTTQKGANANPSRQQRRGQTNPQSQNTPASLSSHPPLRLLLLYLCATQVQVDCSWQVGFFYFG